MAQNTPGQQLSDLLVTRGYDPEMLDSSGKAAASAQDAEIFSFDFVTSNGTNHGTVVVMLGDDKELNVFSGDNVGRGMDSKDKTEWYEFQHQLKNFATKNFMTFSSQNINKLKYSMQGQAALKEGLCESWNGTKNVSWNGSPDSVRLMIRHKRPMGTDEARFRQVESLFVETADGERHRLPFRSLGGGRAMVEHVRQGGKPYDMRGQHIANMVEELNVLSRFRRASKGQVFEGDTANLVAETNRYYETICRTVKGMSSSKGYNSYFESWNPADITEQDLIIEDIKTLFVQETIDARIEQALPILARIQQQGTAMKEANIFEAWAERLVEGTWATPNTPEQKQQLIELLSQELPVGADATNATEQLYSLLGDDVLFDQLQELADADANADARELVIARMTELADSGSDPDLMAVLAALEPKGNDVATDDNEDYYALPDEFGDRPVAEGQGPSDAERLDHYHDLKADGMDPDAAEEEAYGTDDWYTDMNEQDPIARMMEMAGIPLREGVLDDVRARIDTRRNPVATKPALPAASTPAAAAADYTPQVGDEVLYRHSDPRSKMMPMLGTVVAVAPGKVTLEIHSKRMIQDLGKNTIDLDLNQYTVQPSGMVAIGSDKPVATAEALDRLPRPDNWKPPVPNSRPRPASQKQMEVGDIIGFTPQNYDATSSGKVFKAKVLGFGPGRSEVQLTLLNPEDIAANGGKDTMKISFWGANIKNPYVEPASPAQDPAGSATSPETIKNDAVDAKGRTQDQWEKAVMAKYPDAQIQKTMGINSPMLAILPDGRRLSWKKAAPATATPVAEGDTEFDASKIDPDTKCKTCGVPFKRHFEFDANGNITYTLVRHPTMKDDFPGMPGMDPSAFKPKPLTPRPTPGTSNLARPNPTPELPQATMTQNKTTGEALIRYNGKLYRPGGKVPEGATGTRVFVPAAAFGIRSMGNVIALLTDDGTAHAERPLKVYNTMYQQAKQGAAKPGAALDEAGEWKAEAEDFKEWSNHVKDALLDVAESQRFAMAKRLSQIETKHFGAGQAASSFNAQTGASTGNSSGMTTTVQHILDAINAGKLTKATSPAATAAIASAGTTQQTAFGSVTKPAGQPDPYQASPALAGGDRQAALNRLKGDTNYAAATTLSGPSSGSIKILRTEQDWEEALSDPDYGRDLDAPDPDTPAGFKAEMAKLPSWKIMLTTILLALKMPIIGDKLRKVMVSKMQENFGVTMSPKEVLEYIGHVRNTEPDQIIPPAVWKFERDGGDYETALEQLPDDAVEVRPAEVMSTIATGLIDAGLAQEIKPEDETPSDAGAGAFGNMASQLTKKDEPVAESTELNTMLKYAGIPVAESRVLDEAGETLDHVLNRFKHEVKQFEQGNDMDSDLYEALFDYYSDAGEIPYGIAKARTGDPFTWVSNKLAQHLGVNEGVAGSLLGGIAGAALTKTPGGVMAGSRLGSAAQDAVFGSPEETDEGQHTQHGMDANAGRDDYEDEKLADIKPMSFSQDPIQATTDRALKYSAQGVNKLRDLFREDEEAVVENQDKFSALSGQYGHSGKLQKFDDVEQDVLARLKQLSGMIRPM